MPYGSIQSFLDGVTSTVNRSVIGYLIISVSTVAAVTLIGDFEPIIFVTWPLLLLFAALAWQYLIFVSVPLLLALAAFYFYSIREGFDRQNIFVLAAFPFFLVSAPFWYAAACSPFSGDILQPVISFVLFTGACWFYWKPPKFRKPWCLDGERP